MADWDSTFDSAINTKTTLSTFSPIEDNDSSTNYFPADDTTATTNGYSDHSRRSSRSSDNSSSNKENQYARKDSEVSENTADNSSERELILRGGSELREESKTDPLSFHNPALQINNGSAPDIPTRQPVSSQISAPGTAKARAAKSPYSTPVDAIPEEDISVPNDANLSNFSVDQVSNFLRCLKVDDRIITHLNRKSVDGKRFARLKDSELDNLGMKNPVIVFFRDKSAPKPKKNKGAFML